MTELEVLNFIAAALHSMYDRTTGVFHYLIDGNFVCRTAFQLYHGLSHYKLTHARNMVKGNLLDRCSLPTAANVLRARASPAKQHATHDNDNAINYLQMGSQSCRMVA